MKFFCRAARPVDLAAQVQPMIQTPDHSSFPSGHAAEAFAIATVLHHLAAGRRPDQGAAAEALPFKLAHRIATNRTVAGVHFPVDSLAGALLGCRIGALMILLGGGLFLIAKSTLEIHHALEGEHEDGAGGAKPVRASFASVLVQVAMLDVVFSLDSVITAVGMVDHIAIKCIPSLIPDSIEVRVDSLEEGQHLKASQIELPEGLSLAIDPETEIATVISAGGGEAPAEDGEGEGEGEGEA